MFFYYFDNLLYPTILIALSNVHLKLLADISTSEFEECFLVHVDKILCHPCQSEKVSDHSERMHSHV